MILNMETIVIIDWVKGILGVIVQRIYMLNILLNNIKPVTHYQGNKILIIFHAKDMNNPMRTKILKNPNN